MKNLFTLFTIAALTISVFAQSPQKMNYQAVVRNASGVLQANQAVGMKISILQGSETGTAVYVETQTKTTNANGLVTLEIGSGTIVSGTFSGIDWSNGNYFIKTETDPTGGTNYTVTGISQILSVPYALYSKIAKTANYNDLTNKPTTLSGYGITDAVSVAGTQTISGETTFKGTTPDLEAPLFEVKNKDGQTIFAVYNEGVRIWVADGAKGTKGGFAVGGFDMIQKYFDVSSDSVRIYIDSNPSTKEAKGGFAVGGYDMTKGVTGDYFNVSGRSEAETINGESRVMWYPVKEAFRSGKVLIESQDSVGTNSWASGFNSKAVGDWSQALGYKAVARADYSTAIGKNAVAAKINSFAFGEDATAKNEESYAIGRGAVASGYRSFAFGSAGIDSAGKVTDVARAIGDYSVAIGQGSQAVGFGGVSMGIADTANGKYSIALGYGCSANEVGSVTLGYLSSAKGDNSIAIGYYCEATEWASTAIGQFAKAKGMFSTAFGSGKALGGYSTALGEGSQSGYGATAMGGFTVASGDYSTAMGKSTVASKLGSTAMGEHTQATGSYSTSMGGMTQATETGSTAMGQSTKARGKYSTAMGYCGVARGDLSTDMGYFTIAKPYASLVLGRYNDTTCSVNGSTSWVATDPLFICGNGSGDGSRSNAFAVYKNGNAYIQGNLGIGTLSPQTVLHIKGNAPILNLEGSDHCYMQWYPDGYTAGRKGYFGYPSASVNDITLANEISSGDIILLPGSTGNVGIGTTTPSAKLHVAGTTKSVTYTGSAAATAQFQAWTDGTAQGLNAVYSFYPTFQTTADNGPRRAADIVSGFNGGAWGAEYLSFNVGKSGAANDGQILTTERMRITGNGNVGIGTLTAYYRLTVNGTAWCSSGAWTGSDIRWKKNIKDLNNSLSGILKLNAVSYELKTDEYPEMGFQTGTQIGLIAQDVEKVFPELVIADNNGFKAVSYEKLSVILVEGMKEQQQLIQEQQKQIDELKQLVSSLMQK